MMADLFLNGLLLGIVNAAPVGPVGLLCLRRNLAPRRATGLSAGGGMAVAYAIIAFCVVAGLKPFGQFLEAHQPILRAAAGMILLFTGWRSLRPATDPGAIDGPGRCLGEFSASFALTLFNPVPFATFALILPAFSSIGTDPDIPTDLAFAASVAAGTAVFWLAVNELIHRVRRRSPESFPCLIAKSSSIVLLVFGALLLLSGIA
jgi:threonine/homoserine/homoserine lactone efflux protein